MNPVGGRYVCFLALAAGALWAVCSCAVACVEGDVGGEAMTTERDKGSLATGERRA